MMLPMIELRRARTHLLVQEYVMKVSAQELAIRLKRKTLQAADSLKAMAEYQAFGVSTRQKTERLKTERLAKVAADHAIAAIEIVKSARKQTAAKTSARRRLVNPRIR
jgi:hypothetical protein